MRSPRLPVVPAVAAAPVEDALEQNTPVQRVPAEAVAPIEDALEQDTTVTEGQETVPGYNVDLTDDYEKPQGQLSLGIHPEVRVIVGSDRDEDMHYMAQIAMCRQIRPGAKYKGRSVIEHEELCQKRVQSDGMTYLWRDGGPLWMETWGHWEAREKARHRARALKFQHNLEQVEEAIRSRGFPMEP